MDLRYLGASLGRGRRGLLAGPFCRLLVGHYGSHVAFPQPSLGPLPSYEDDVCLSAPPSPSLFRPYLRGFLLSHPELRLHSHTRPAPPLIVSSCLHWSACTRRPGQSTHPAETSCSSWHHTPLISLYYMSFVERWMLIDRCIALGHLDISSSTHLTGI
jgi:hypothetical protein